MAKVVKLVGGRKLQIKHGGGGGVFAGIGHKRLHEITSPLDHLSAAIPGRILQADANGLPVNATNTDAQVAAAVTASHARQHSIISTADHTSAATNGQMLKANANGLPVDATNTDAAVAGAVSASHARQHSATSAADHAAATGADKGKYLHNDPTSGALDWQTPAAGGGDFVGPASATANDLVKFADATGKVGADSGILAADVAGAVGASHARQHGIATAADHTGIVTTVADPGLDTTVATEKAVRTAINARAAADSFGVVIDGGTVSPTTGSKGYRVVPFACTITGWEILADASGSAVVDVKKGTYAGFPTTASIAGAEKPTLTGAQKNQNLALTLWTTGLLAGDILEFNLDSVATCKRVTVTLFVTRT